MNNLLIDETFYGVPVKLYADGRFVVRGEKREWYKDSDTGEVWIPKKRSSIRGLIKQIIKEELTN